MANEVFTPEEQEFLALALDYAGGSTLTLHLAEQFGDGSPLAGLAAEVTLVLARKLLDAGKALA